MLMFYEVWMKCVCVVTEGGDGGSSVIDVNIDEGVYEAGLMCLMCMRLA